jgi:hypothetical protein
MCKIATPSTEVLSNLLKSGTPSTELLSNWLESETPFTELLSNWLESGTPFTELLSNWFYFFMKCSSSWRLLTRSERQTREDVRDDVLDAEYASVSRNSAIKMWNSVSQMSNSAIQISTSAI